MDSPHTAARSPPQPVKDMITASVMEWRTLSKRIVNKQRAVAKLETAVPKSVRTKMDLKVPSILTERAPDTVAELSSQFQTAIADHQDKLRGIIHASAVSELQVLEQERHNVYGSTVDKFKSFFKPLHDSLRQAHPALNQQEFEAYFCDGGDGISPSPSLAIIDCRRAISFLDIRLQEEEYSHLMAEAIATRKREEAAAKRTAAETMELDTSNDVLVATLVKKSIAKETSALRNEVNQLRAALNSRASHHGASAGAKQLPKRQSKQPNAGEKARAQPNGRNVHPSKPRNPKATPKGPRDAKPSKPAGRNSKPRQPSRRN